MDSVIVFLIASYLNVSVDSAKFYYNEGWHIPDTTHLFSASWTSHSAHVLPVKVPTYQKQKNFPLFYGVFNSYSSPCMGSKSSGYGYRWGKNHYGIDLAGSKGDPIYAGFDGVVRYATYNNGGYGNLIVIRHYNGLETYYAHLSSIDVKKGDRVKSGTMIGKMGNTGHSFGNHLHFEIRILGYPIDPELIFDFINQKIKIYSYYINSKGIGIEVNKNSFCDEEKCVFHKSYDNLRIIQKEKDTIETTPRVKRNFGNM